MIIKMVTEFKLTLINFCTPKPDADLYMRMDLPGHHGPRATGCRTTGLLFAKPNLQYLQLMLYEDNQCNDIERRT